MNFRRAERMAVVQKSVIRQIVDRAKPGDINLGLGEPAFPLPPFIRMAAAEALARPRLNYTTTRGIVELRSLVAEYCGRASIDEICITTGAQEALMAVMFALLNSGDHVLLPDPGFLAYPTCARLAGAECDFYQQLPEEKFAFSAERFRAALTPHTKLVVINSPANPTGQILTEADLRAIADILTGTDIWVLADEIYSELYYETAPSSISRYYTQTIVVSGLSKSMGMTGWRLGWAAAPPTAIAAIDIMHQYFTTCAATISQLAALKAFTPAALNAVVEFRAQLREQRDLLADAVQAQLQTDFIMPAGAFYMMVDVRRWGTSMSVAERLLDYGVITIPGSAFGDCGEGFLRISFSPPLAELREGITRLARGLSQLRS
ncbi:MAG: pyridoxal phosphate-dependent aminotransferase [Acidobacteriota bacterium]